MLRTLAVLLTVMSVVIASITTAVAQEATPPEEDSPYPYTPDPADCVVEEVRPVDEFVEIVVEVTPRAEVPTSIPISLGRPADPATIDAVTSTLVTFVACTNAGDRQSAYSLWTENQVRWLTYVNPISEEQLRPILEASPEARTTETQATILAISSVRILPDGRVATFLTATFGDDPPVTDAFILVEQDGRWMIDQIRGFYVFPPAEGTPPASEGNATPTG